MTKEITNEQEIGWLQCDDCGEWFSKPVERHPKVGREITDRECPNCGGWDGNGSTFFRISKPEKPEKKEELTEKQKEENKRVFNQKTNSYTESVLNGSYEE